MSLCRASSVGQKDNVIGEAALDLAQLSALPGPWLSLACHYLGCALATDRAGHGLGNGGTAARASVSYSVAGQAACSLGCSLNAGRTATLHCAHWDARNTAPDACHVRVHCRLNVFWPTDPPTLILSTVSNRCIQRSAHIYDGQPVGTQLAFGAFGKPNKLAQRACRARSVRTRVAYSEPSCEPAASQPRASKGEKCSEMNLVEPCSGSYVCVVRRAGVVGTAHGSTAARHAGVLLPNPSRDFCVLARIERVRWSTYGTVWRHERTSSRCRERHCPCCPCPSTPDGSGAQSPNAWLRRAARSSSRTIVAVFSPPCP